MNTGQNPGQNRPPQQNAATGPSQQERIATLTQQQIASLNKRLQLELQGVLTHGPQSELGQQHFMKSQQVKNIIQQYHTFHRQNGNTANAAVAAAGLQHLAQLTPQQKATLAQAAQYNQLTAQQRGQQMNPQQQQQQQQPQQQQQQQRPPSAQVPQTQLTAQQQQQLRNQQLVQQQRQQGQNLNPLQQRAMQLQQVAQQQVELQQQLDRVEIALQNQSLSAQERQNLQQQQTAIRNKKDQYRTLELNLKQQQQRAASGQQIAGAQQPGGARPGVPMQTQQAQMQAQMAAANRQGSPAGQQPVPVPRLPQGQQPQQQNPQAMAQTQAQIQARLRAQQQQQQQQQQGVAVQGRSQSPQTAQGAAAVRGGTPVNTLGPSARPNPPHQNSPAVMINQRTPVSSIVIQDQINTKTPTPVATKAQRPTLTGGSSSSASALNTPAIAKLPPIELAGDRVLSKRKLRELVTSVVGDEETQIDGDVEDLLLDLADEFVTSVTSFSCRLAKHRKSDILEAKDVQLHLERNWNIRIPGYSADEVRAVRKIQPTAGYASKLQGVNVAKSVSGNRI